MKATSLLLGSTMLCEDQMCYEDMLDYGVELFEKRLKKGEGEEKKKHGWDLTVS